MSDTPLLNHPDSQGLTRAIGVSATRDFGAPVLAVCGFSGSGKTALLEAAIPQLLALGLSVAVVKHAAHGFIVDKEGKDSDRFFRAGATVALRGPSEQFQRRRPSAVLTLEETLADLARDHDIVLVEGHKETPLPKLWLGSTEVASIPPGVTQVLDTLAWNGDRLQSFLRFFVPWYSEAWKRRPLFAGLLLGGKSLRMGTPKQMLPFGNSNLGEIVAKALSQALKTAVPESPVCEPGSLHPRLILLGAGSIPEALICQPRLVDPPGLAGPLAALLAAHRWAPTAAWLVAACDHPWLKAEDLEAFIEQRQPGRWAIVSRQRDAHPAPTLALYEPQALHLLERSLWTRGAEDTRLAQLLDDAHTWVAPNGARSAESVNTPEEYMAALRADAPTMRQ
jgi:molybdopterin-guanine dinucleotide biosynthesis protein A